MVELLHSSPSFPLTAQRGTRVLIAEDHEDSREVLGELLGCLGYHVRTAMDGLDALDIARTFHPELVLLDIRMPRLDGVETCRELRAAGLCSPDASFIAVTADGTLTAEGRRCFDDVVFKPVDFEKLVAVLENQRS
jgi:two-component system response regulator MprA